LPAGLPINGCFVASFCLQSRTARQRPFKGHLVRWDHRESALYRHLAISARSIQRVLLDHQGRHYLTDETFIKVSRPAQFQHQPWLRPALVQWVLWPGRLAGWPSPCRGGLSSSTSAGWKLQMIRTRWQHFVAMNRNCTLPPGESPRTPWPPHHHG